ncbi:MAG: hypothetical protein Q8R92_21235 [Deltaproteobacteria bacterium]|nr:hypothetical protein [Deltaproteobacteria bacterium]
MSRTPAKVTQADIARAIRAIAQTGAKLAVEIAPDGTIRLVPVDSGNNEPTPVAVREEIRL